MRKSFDLLFFFCAFGLLFFASCEKDDDNNESNVGDVFMEPDTIQTLYFQDFSKGDFYNWTSSESWTLTDSGARLEVGKTSYLKNYYSVNKRTCRLQFVPSVDCEFSVGIDDEIIGIGSSLWAAKVDAKTQTVSFGDVVKDMVLSESHKYELSLRTHDLMNYLSVVDLDSTDNSVDFSAYFNEANDFYGIKMLAGSSPVFKSIQVESQKNPFVVFYGNSVTFGFGTTFVDGHPATNFGTIVGQAIHRDYMLSGRGGDMITQLLGDESFNGRFDTEIKHLKPKYVVITIGTNGGNTYENLSELIYKVKSVGSIPILNNIPCIGMLENEEWINKDRTENELIERVRADFGLNGAKLDVATSVNGDGISTIGDFYNLDFAWGTTIRIHPNDEGHKAMANQIMKDCPELFE